MSDNWPATANALLKLSQRVSALELAVFAACKTAFDKDGLMADIDRLAEGLKPPVDADEKSLAHFNEIKRLLLQYRQYAEIGKHLRPGQ